MSKAALSPIRIPRHVYGGIERKYFRLRVLMDGISDYFSCDGCNNRNFVRIYNFSVRFRTVNFSDELMYDEVVEELYQCTQCQKTFRRHQIDSRLREVIEKRHKSVLGASGKG